MVTVENEYGISVTARITEVMEVDDDTGYSVEPKFEYLEINQTEVIYIGTESNNELSTEDNKLIVIEGGI